MVMRMPNAVTATSGYVALPENVQFWTLHYEDGTVHVHMGFVDGENYGRVNMPFNPWMRARCGLLRREQEGVRIGSFDDHRLCRSCSQAVCPSERDRLFEHPQETAGW